MRLSPSNENSPRVWSVRPNEIESEQQRRTLDYWFELFQLLRISPTYDVIHRLMTKEVEEAPLETPELTEAILTYHRLGDVSRTFFLPWFRRIAETEASFGQPILDSYAASKLDLETLSSGVDLLLLKAATNAGDWQLQLMRKSPEERAKQFHVDPQSSRYVRLSQLVPGYDTFDSDVYKKEIASLRSSANRDLKKYKLMAENAARGRFFCFDLMPLPEFDWPAIGERLKACFQWEHDEMNPRQAKLFC